MDVAIAIAGIVVGMLITIIGSYLRKQHDYGAMQSQVSTLKSELDKIEPRLRHMDEHILRMSNDIAAIKATVELLIERQK